jgi:membrane protease YdiL (CAAX protease family)
VHSVDPISQPEPLPPALDTAQPASINNGEDTGIDLVDAGLVVAFALGALFFCTIISEFIFSLAHRSQHLSPEAFVNAFSHNAFFQVPAEFAAYVLLMIFMAALVWRRHKTGLLQAVGWNAPARKRTSYALAVGASMALFSALAEVLLQRWTPKSLPINEFFRDRPSAWLLAAFGILVAPLMEELVFRGFLYPALARLTGVAPAVVITGGGFALLHGMQLGFAWAPLLVLLIVGLALTVTRVVTRSVAFCVLMHMAYNFVIFTQVFIGTQGFRHWQD